MSSVAASQAQYILQVLSGGWAWEKRSAYCAVCCGKAPSSKLSFQRQVRSFHDDDYADESQHYEEISMLSTHLDTISLFNEEIVCYHIN